MVLHDAGVDGHLFGRMDQYKIVVGNYGMHPITNVVGKLVYRETQAQLGKFIGGPAPLPVLEGGKRQQLQWEVMIKWPGAAQQHELPDHFDLEVQFTDVNGIRWAVRPGLGQQPSRVYDIE
ncbi:hypothetical protein CLV67_103228 [Actinoplanes italicus]|uniref:Uncharacterized protein n=1 Tax=Actinoplanes italicus TaxID=113567 RepID=A0A2T0KIX3_9ACTN|nr:hypothetical protein CLV67_103228 [Actinoplanes italicus]